jgi:predicted Zn-dependent protease
LALMCAAALALPAHGLRAQTPPTPAAPLPPGDNAPRLPALGESAAQDLGVGAERRLGDEIMAQIRRDPDYLEDPVLLEYLQSLWQPLVEAAYRRGDIGPDLQDQFAFEAFLVRDRAVNAFALPGGFVGVYLGMVALTGSRDELASVLAHELTHVTQRHIARSLTNQERSTLLSLAGMVLALLAASRSNSPDVAQAAILGGQAAAIQGQLNFSRDMEREADRIGFTDFLQAGFDGDGMAAMFDKLDGANRHNDSGAYPYLRTHPLTVERIAEARLRTQNLHTAQRPAAAAPLPPSLLHALMAARSRVLMDPGTAALRRLQQPLAPRPGQTVAEQLGALYAAALASSLLREPALAEQHSRAAQALLAAQAPADPLAQRSLALLDAEIRLAAGDADGADRLLTDIGQRWPDESLRRPVLMLRGQAALQRSAGGRGAAETQAPLRASVEALQTWVAQYPRDAAAWQLLGLNAEALGLRLRALRAQAEARLLLGDLRGAIDRLRGGRDLARQGNVGGQDFIDVSIIDARLRQLEAQRRQAMEEARQQRGGRAPPDGDG